ncbi:Fic family protein [Avibacterium avium]|uniref:Fic family protein n=1 Tax=Avibacterium avium TaxID=751 RepID=UPI003BF7C3FC
MNNYNFDTLMAMLDSKRPLDNVTAENLQAHFNLKYNQSSNAIEGNQLTLNETRVLLEKGITAKGKPFKDHLDIINHKSAIDYLMDIVRKNETLSEKNILEFNYLLLKGTKDEYYAGKIRNAPVTIEGSEHIPPQPYLVQSRLDNMIITYNDRIANANNDEKINLIANLHAEFVNIHPFTDGNGRTGRLLMNFELLKHGYPLSIIPDSERMEYYEALSEYDKGNPVSIQRFIKNSVQSTLCETLNIIYPDWEKEYPEFKKR